MKTLKKSPKFLKIVKSNYKTFSSLKKKCISQKQLFIDDTFPPTNSSLYLDINYNNDIIWKRPGEVVSNPQLFVEGTSSNDVIQGILGNCWFVSACSVLVHNKDLILKVIPNPAEQEWGSEKLTKNKYNAYAGIFLFRFWKFGKWIEIIIDDLLPTKDEKLLFAHSKTKNEFWIALLEKAFAKLYGCYENLVGGQLLDALQDVSGGVTKTINLNKYFNRNLYTTKFYSNLILTSENNSTKDVITDKTRQLFESLHYAFNQHALILAAIATKNKNNIEKSLSCGLVIDHAYAVTAIRYIKLDAVNENYCSSQQNLFATIEQKMMIRLRNPWGEKEWNGPWSDGSVEWEKVTSTQKKQLGITVDEDGEFWMSFDQFVKYFTDISVCFLFETFSSISNYSKILKNSKKRKQKILNLKIISAKQNESIINSLMKDKNLSIYNEYIFYDSWTTNGVKSGAPNDRSGGCEKFFATFCCNPQFCFNIKDKDCSEIIIGLTQNEIFDTALRQRKQFVTIGLHVMRVESNRIYRIHQSINPIATSDYASSRSIYLNLSNLTIGCYILLPTTYAPREQAEFMLRLYSKSKINPQKLIYDFPKPFCCLFKNLAITKIKIIKLTFENIERIDDVCCIICSKNKKYKASKLTIKSEEINFDESFLFYSNSLRQSYKFIIQDNVSGKKIAFSLLNIQTKNDSAFYSVNMYKKNNKIIGKLMLQLSSYEDLLYL